MKIVVLAAYPLTKEVYGSFVHVDKLTQYISRMNGMELHVITFGDKNEQLKRGNVYVHVVNKLWFFTPFLLPFTIWYIKRIIIRIHPDVVHAFGSFPDSTLGVLFRDKYPILLTVLRVVTKEIESEAKMHIVLRKLLISKPNEKYVLKRIPHIIVQSHFTESIIREYTNSKTYIVPEGIEVKKSQQLQVLASVSKSPDIFIAVALRKAKGLDILIKAIPAVLKQVPELKVFIAGSGSEEKELKGLVKQLNLENHVKFLGFISGEQEINKYYGACKIVVAPSRWDVEPFAPLNAAVWGKPAIVSEMCNSSLVKDGKTGFVIKPEDAKGLASKIVELLTNDKLREEMGKAAMEKVKEYDWKKIAEKTLNIYKEVIADFHERNGKK